MTGAAVSSFSQKKMSLFFGGPGPSKLPLLMHEIESNEGVGAPHVATVTHFYIATLEIYILQIQAMPLAT